VADDPLISNVSDTARWVAQYRAIESARPDALFRDPLSGRLAGERGAAILAASPRRLRSGWNIIARTKIIDELIAACLAEGCQRVVNLAAGLDTRPYRLALPATLTWIEADLPGIVDEKERLLAGETPACKLGRHRVDLSDPVARAALLAGLAGGPPTLVITEGLVHYLDPEVVAALSRDLQVDAGTPRRPPHGLRPRDRRRLLRDRRLARSGGPLPPPRGGALSSGAAAAASSRLGARS
jgi:methyltransferase (TIGR00027 family)